MSRNICKKVKMRKKNFSFLIYFFYLSSAVFSLLSANSPSDYLLFSTEHGYLQHTKKALQNGANVNVKDYFQRTPLMYASASGNLEIVQLLLKHGASLSINERDRDGKTAFMFAKEKGFKKIMQILLEYGAREE